MAMRVTKAGMGTLLLTAAAMMAMMVLVGCSDDDGCVVAPASGCGPLYQPSFDNVFENTLLPTCGSNGSACHAPEGAKGGLVFANADDSYNQLTDSSTGAARVLAGDSSCSPLMGRLAAEEDELLMPPGQRLSDAELCAISSWIANGAMR